MGQVTYEADSAPKTTDAAQNVAPVEEGDDVTLRPAQPTALATL